MEKLIADLLDVSEMERGHLKIDKKQCDIRSLLDPVTDTFAGNAKSKAIDLTITCPQDVRPICADPDRVVQVLSNLVGNALKFTPENGKVSVDVCALPGEARFSVRDTGPGMSDEDLPHLFEQFWKANGHGKMGKGLGLYIAKMIVEDHGGRIWAERGTSGGSAFFFTIPY
jgi:signal transduction histidine kinase